MKPAPLTMGPSSEQACAGVLVTCDWLPVTSSPMWATFTTSTIVFIITTRRATITVSCSVYLMQSGQLISQATLRQEWILVWANFFANRTASDFNSISFINLHHSIVLCFLVSFFLFSLIVQAVGYVSTMYMFTVVFVITRVYEIRVLWINN